MLAKIPWVNRIDRSIMEREAQEELAGSRTTIDARDYGLSPDLADNSDAISAALVAANGLPVTIPAKRYRTKKPIIVPSGATIMGTGRGTVIERDGTLVNGDASAFEIVGHTGARLSGIRIQGLVIEGPSTEAASVAGNGVTVTESDNVTIADCEIYGFGAAGDDGAIAAVDVTLLTILDTTCHDNLNGPIFGKAGGVTPPSCTDVLVSGCVFHENWADGSHGQNCDRVQWIGNRSYLNGESGIDLLGCWDCVIAENVCYDNGHEGIEIGQTVTTGREDRGHSVTGNICIGNHTTTGAGGGGILLSGKTSHCVVSGNVCRANLHAGIHAGNTGVTYLVEHNLIADNVCENNVQVGIHISGNALNNVVQGNSVKNNKDRGIDMTTSGTTPTGTIVRGNVILGNTGVAVYRSGGLDATTIVRDNIGYATEAMGSATVADASATVVVNHGLAAAPKSVILTPQASADVWVSARTATTFTISRTVTTGALAVDWLARV